MKKFFIIISLIICFSSFAGCAGETYPAKFIGMNNIGKLKSFVITTKDELNNAVKSLPGGYSLTESFQTQNSLYKNEYFEKNNLVLIFFSNEDFQTEIKKITVKDEILIVYFKERYNGVTIELMSWGACYIEIDNKLITKVEIKTQ